MLRFETSRQVAIFDLDGCIVENPAVAKGPGAKLIADHDFWGRHWRDYHNAEVNWHVVALMNALLDARWHVIILTARPESYRHWTRLLLERVGWPSPAKEPEIVSKYPYPYLVMRPDDDGWAGSGPWKRDVISDWIIDGAKIQFMMEDFKPNADAIRSVVPVLMYERMK